MADAAKSNMEKLANELDQLIRQGELGKARKQLLRINIQKIPRRQCVAMADLARRLNVPKMIISILKPIIRPERQFDSKASDREMALYATGLSRLGVFSEAEELLNSLSGSEMPEVLLFRAQNAMLKWDYESPIPVLRRYIESPSISEYEKLVGMMNLAASHIWNLNWIDGERVVQTIIGIVTKKHDGQQYRLIHGYALELLAEMHILKRDFAKARTIISESLHILLNTQSRYEFFAKKWFAILELLESPSSENLLNLDSIRRTAVSLSDWETSRDCDFYEALAYRNDALFKKVFYGTNFGSYKKRVRKLYSPSFSTSTPYLWNFNTDSIDAPAARVFDLGTAQEQNQRSSNLSGHPLLLKLLRILTQDFYRPVAFGSVVSSLYPDEFFNPISSPKKAHQIVSRLRAWFRSQNIPLTIEVVNESCRLLASAPYSILIPNRAIQNPKEVNCLQIFLTSSYSAVHRTASRRAPETVKSIRPETSEFSSETTKGSDALIGTGMPLSVQIEFDRAF